MRHYILSAAERGQLDFTDVFWVYGPTDFTGAVNDTAQNLALMTLNKGDVVMDGTTVDLITALPVVAGDTLTISVGRTATAYTDCLAAYTLENAGTPVASGASITTGAAVAHQNIAADATVLYAQLLPSGTQTVVAFAGSSELRIWMKILRRAERNMQST